MRKVAMLYAAVIILASGCAAKKPEAPVPGAETVRVGTSHPGASFFELGPVTGVDGQGCGDDGKRGNRDGAVASLMKNAFAMGGTHVQVQALHEPRQMGECFVNVYRITGTAFREAKTASASGDVVQSLRELQKLREAGTITQPEFEKLKASLIR